MMQFRKIALALAFSPRTPALLAEAARLKRMWDANLLLIHVGDYGEKENMLLNELLKGVDLYLGRDVQVLWENGKPSERVLAVCKRENVDLLVAGALKKENLVQYYLGTVARKILRKADCSVLMLTDPLTTPRPFKDIVVNAEDSPFVEDAVRTACTIGLKDKASWLHIVREIKMYGLTMSASDHHSEDEYETLRQNLVKDEIDNVEKILGCIPHEGLKVNIKMLAGKSGFELAKFAQRKHADLLVVGAFPRRFSLFDRVFPHDLEYIFADLPCNLLVVHPHKHEPMKKEVKHG
ncbi:universal stress protein [Ohtaekwangia sp.]|uniref:universal stress protein n=1 Tax=Ohtaekwangia sp. TaxID=2066019 RepID=UPI002F94D6CE